MNRRSTHQKEIIYNIIQGKGNHMTAEEVLQKAKEIDDKIGLATVYRNLNLLCEQGRIQKVTGENYNLFDGNAEPHDHFRCVECGYLVDVPSVANQTIDKKVAKAIRGTILHHSILYEGVCEECQRRQKEKSWN
ncbi:MAG: transcriptional repressor [Solobacterium sp.]|nr:transcriptional repressor [Solobacterium sp.]